MIFMFLFKERQVKTLSDKTDKNSTFVTLEKHAVVITLTVLASFQIFLLYSSIITS